MKAMKVMNRSVVLGVALICGVVLAMGAPCFAEEESQDWEYGAVASAPRRPGRPASAARA